MWIALFSTELTGLTVLTQWDEKSVSSAKRFFIGALFRAASNRSSEAQAAPENAAAYFFPKTPFEAQTTGRMLLTSDSFRSPWCGEGRANATNSKTSTSGIAIFFVIHSFYG